MTKARPIKKRKKTKKHVAQPNVTSLKLPPATLAGIERAVEIATTPPERDRVVIAVKQLRHRAHSAEEREKQLKHQLAEHAARADRSSPPYDFDADARIVTRRATGERYAMHEAAFRILQDLHRRWQEGKPPVLAVRLTPDGRKGIHDAFLKPKTLDGKKALKDLVIRDRERLSLRVP